MTKEDEELLIEIKAEVAMLREHSAMLGRIANAVSDFAEHSEDSTYLCVLRLLAQYHDNKCSELYYRIAKEESREEV